MIDEAAEHQHHAERLHLVPQPRPERLRREPVLMLAVEVRCRRSMETWRPASSDQLDDQ